MIEGRFDDIVSRVQRLEAGEGVSGQGSGNEARGRTGLLGQVAMVTPARAAEEARRLLGIGAGGSAPPTGQERLAEMRARQLADRGRWSGTAAGSGAVGPPPGRSGGPGQAGVAAARSRALPKGGAAPGSSAGGRGGAQALGGRLGWGGLAEAGAAGGEVVGPDAALALAEAIQGLSASLTGRRSVEEDFGLDSGGAAQTEEEYASTLR